MLPVDKRPKMWYRTVLFAGRILFDLGFSFMRSELIELFPLRHVIIPAALADRDIREGMVKARTTIYLKISL